jgi:arylsulfatase A-like enzyme
LLAKLKSSGLEENTIVVFTSDNGGLHVPEGPHARITHNTPYRAGKGFLYEGGIRVPAIVRWPGRVAPGRQLPCPTMSTDWVPSLLDMAGLKSTDAFDGVSLGGVLTGKPAPPGRALFWHVPHYTNQGSRPSGAVREGRWKLVLHYEDDSTELFDVDADPGEKVDRSRQDRAVVERLLGMLRGWLHHVGAQTNRPNPEFDPDLHRRLYVEFDPSKYDPTDVAAAERARAWRQGMNAVVTKARKSK